MTVDPLPEVFVEHVPPHSEVVRGSIAMACLMVAMGVVIVVATGPFRRRQQELARIYSEEGKTSHQGGRSL